MKFPWGGKEESTSKTTETVIPQAPMGSPFHTQERVQTPVVEVEQKPVSPNFIKRFFTFIGPMPKLPNPGKYEEIAKESKSIIGTSDVFDGFRFDYNKGVSEVLSVNHSIGLGSVMEAPSYNFGATYINKGSFLWGRIDTEGQLYARWHQALNEDILLRVGGQVTAEPHNSGVQVEVDWKGDDWYVQGKWANPGTYGLSYMQSITPSLSLGCDGFYNYKQGMTMLTYGLRYATEQQISTAVLADGHLSFSYTHKVNEKVGLSTDVTFQISQQGLESLFSMGYEYKLRISSFRAHIDSGGRIAGFLEEGLNQFTRFVLCGELDHAKKQYRFGLGIQMQL